MDGGFRSGERTNADGGLRFAGSWDSDGEPEHPASGVFRLGESGTHAGSLPTRPYFAAPRPGEPVSPGDEPGENAVSLRRWRGRALAGFAAVSTAAAVALGVVAFDARRDLDARETAMAAVLAAPDARTVRHRIAPGGTGTAVVSRDQGRILFTSRGMPEPPPSKVYALWLMGPGGVRPAALLDPGEDGLTTPVLADLGDADHLGLTVEPAGGSDRPTTRPILFTPLPAS